MKIHSTDEIVHEENLSKIYFMINKEEFHQYPTKFNSNFLYSDGECEGEGVRVILFRSLSPSSHPHPHPG
jgi:hypothetical protein